MSDEKQRLKDLFEYAKHVGRLNEKATFSLDEYKQLAYSEHALKGRIGIHHDVVDEDGEPIWLKVDRLTRTHPPVRPEVINDWITVTNDPCKTVVIKDTLIKTILASEASELLNREVVNESDVTEPLKKHDDHIERKDVIFRLEKLPEIKDKIELYINNSWYPWAEEEKPKRDTIKIYDDLFYLQQTLEAQGDELSLEFVWGIGISRWNVAGRKIDHPLVEYFVELELDNNTGSLLIRPRKLPPEIAIAPYLALDNPGAESLMRFFKKQIQDFSDDIEFSPYIARSYEAVLKQSARVLSESGVYWPEVNGDIEDREPPKINEELCITDSWVIYVRPKSATSFIQDIERFEEQLEDKDIEEINTPAVQLVSRLSSERPPTGPGSIGSGGGESKVKTPATKGELYFPKPFNDAQVKIIDRLVSNDGVVVQGPPGTGKTHTIANIISHYLATGKRVLVTSKGKPALDVLREQIPVELRNLTISLLSNEREGFKQLETAVSVLSNISSQTDIRSLSNEANALSQRVDQLKTQIAGIDSELREWGEKQLKPIRHELAVGRKQMTAMELAEYVIQNKDQHDWFPDEIGDTEDFKPLFFDADIANLREARRALGSNLSYVFKRLPSLSDFPDSAQIAAIHEDLVNSHNIGEQAKKDHLPPLAVTVENALSRAEALLPNLKQLLLTIEGIEKKPWLRYLFDNWCVSGLQGEDTFLFDELQIDLVNIVDKRIDFIRNPVQMPDPSKNRLVIDGAINNLCNGRSAFGFFSFGHAEAKSLIDKIEVRNETPSSEKDWEHVEKYLKFQDSVRKFVVKWNSIGQEYDLPELSYNFGGLFKDLEKLHNIINDAVNLATVQWKEIRQELKILLPHGLNIGVILYDKLEAEKAINALEASTARIQLSAQRKRIEDFLNKLNGCSGEIVEEFKQFFEGAIGNASVTVEKMLRQWNDLVEKLRRIHDLSDHIMIVESVVGLIQESGAKKWATILIENVYSGDEDKWTPSFWFDSWVWKQQESYIKSLDAREHLKTISEQRSSLDKDLKKTFTELVRVKTSIGLHSSLSDKVKGALARFVSAIARIGRGTGVRAPRFRKDAFRAMQDCYDGVPCWIMPTWRVSESLPSIFGGFDLVIIDEASQSDISTLPVIMRAKKLLVVGDDKQVSPTGAFIKEEKILQLRHNFLRDQPFGELLVPGTSIYDLASAIFPSQRIVLTEHFRCVEPIIRFSMQFYNEMLIPLRIPKMSERLDPPLIDVYVPYGKRDERKKINNAEVEAIVEEIKLIVENPQYANRSIGVISLIGAQQAHAIQEALLQEIGEGAYIRHNISCGDSAVFQGKEKDIIFLSMVVGVKQGAAMTKRESEQRFNVALSRARDRMYLYRSITEADLLNEADLRLKTIKHFQNPMPQRQEADNLLDLCDSGFERDVFRKLIDLDYCVTPQVKVGPFSIDLVVEGENDKRLAIELDGDKYHPPEKWKDDFSRQRTMERVGWVFWRCWGSTYSIDPDGCIGDLVNTLTSMGINPTGSKSDKNIYTEYRELKLPVVREGEVVTDDKGSDMQGELGF